MKNDTTSGKGSLSGKDSVMNQGKCSAKPDWKKIPISRKAYKDFVARIICVLEAVTQSQVLVNAAVEMFERFLRNEDIDIVGADPAVQIAFLMIRPDIVKAINRSYAARLRASARKLKKLVAEYPLHREPISATEPAPSQPQDAISEPAMHESSAESHLHTYENSENEVTKNKITENNTIEKEQPVRDLQVPAQPVIKTQPQTSVNPFNQPAALMNRHERRQHEREQLRKQKRPRQK